MMNGQVVFLRSAVKDNRFTAFFFFEIVMKTTGIQSKCLLVQKFHKEL